MKKQTRLVKARKQDWHNYSISVQLPCNSTSWTGSIWIQIVGCEELELNADQNASWTYLTRKACSETFYKTMNNEPTRKHSKLWRDTDKDCKSISRVTIVGLLVITMM